MAQSKCKFFIDNNCEYWIWSYLLIPWSRATENITGFKQVKKLPEFYGTRSFI